MKGISIHICLVVFFLFSGNLLVSGSVSANDLDVLSLSELPEDTRIARVLNRTICLKDINPSQSQIEKYTSDKTAEQLAEWKRQQRRSVLSHYFWPLFENYAKEQDLAVSETEIALLHKTMRQIMAMKANKAREKVASLQKELQAGNLDEKKQSELSGRLDLFTRAAANFEDYNDIETEAAMSQEQSKARNAVSEKMILHWKINSRLYQQYGGRVIFQQAGPEPLDAYRQFLEEEQRKGDFEFFNQEAEALFWEYYRNEKMHTFISDAAEAKKMMESSWWLREPEEPPSAENLDVWGDCTDGLCMKIRPKKGAFNTAEQVTVIVDLLNIGEQTFICSPCPQFFEIEVDGKWYAWNGPKVFDQIGFPLKPKSVNYTFFEIMLTELWLSPETGKPLMLAEGTHYLRARYQPMGIRAKDGFQEITPTFRVTGNLQTFKIIPFEQPLSIIVEGQPEITRKVGQWLAKNPRAVSTGLGQAYRVSMSSLKPQPDNQLTALPHEPDINFKIKIMDPSGNRMTPELEEKLTELIREQVQE